MKPGLIILWHCDGIPLSPGQNDLRFVVVIARISFVEYARIGIFQLKADLQQEDLMKTGFAPDI